MSKTADGTLVKERKLEQRRQSEAAKSSTTSPSLSEDFAGYDYALYLVGAFVDLG